MGLGIGARARARVGCVVEGSLRVRPFLSITCENLSTLMWEISGDMVDI